MSKTLFKGGVVGHVGSTRYNTTESGREVLDLNVATDAENNSTQWVRVTLWGNFAKTMEAYVTKGCLVYAEGPLSIRTFEHKGETRVEPKITAREFLILSYPADEKKPVPKPSNASRGSNEGYNW